MFYLFICIECFALFFALCLPMQPKDGREELYTQIWGTLEGVSVISQYMFLVIHFPFQSIVRYNYVFIAFCGMRLVAEYTLCLTVAGRFQKMRTKRAALVVGNILGLLAIRKADRDRKEANATELVVRSPTESHPEIAAELPKFQAVGDVVWSYINKILNAFPLFKSNSTKLSHFICILFNLFHFFLYINLKTRLQTAVSRK